MLALQFATATPNLASQNAFLFLATHGPIFIASSSSATLITQCGFVAAGTPIHFFELNLDWFTPKKNGYVIWVTG